MYPVVCSDQNIDAALLRAVDRRGRIIGTAFSALADGTCITCDHVLRASNIKFVDTSGQEYRHEHLRVPALARSDIAFFRLIGKGGSLPRPLPLATRANPSSFRMRTWLGEDTGIVNSLPITGRLSGPTKISYEKSGRSYLRQDALALMEPQVRPGMSGTPLIDEVADAVIAIVIASFDDELAAGFALPLSVLEAAMESRGILRRNNDEVKRFGRWPNPRAITEIAETTNRAVLLPGEAGRLFDPAHFIPRADFSAIINEFLQSSATVLAVFGAVGVGKTTALADLSLQTHQPTCFFIRSVDIAKLDFTLDTLLRKRIGKAFDDRPEAMPELVTLAQAASNSGKHLVFLLDGLNEAPLDRTALLDHWLPDAIDTLARLNAKLIFTAKTELRDALLSRHYVDNFFCPPILDEEHRSAARRDKAFFLHFYSATEFDKAKEKYGLDPQLNDSELRHPLTLRLAKEVGVAKSDSSHQLSRRLDILERLFGRLVQKVLERTGLSNKARVVALCERLAMEATRSSGQQVTTPINFDETDEKIFGALLRENVIELMPNGFRFFLDALVDYLASSRLDLLGELKDILAADSLETTNIDVIALAAARCVAKNASDQVVTALRLLIAPLSLQSSLPEIQNREGSPSVYILVTLGDCLATATPPIPALSAIKDEYLKTRFDAGDLHFSTDVLDRAVGAFAPAQQRLLIRNLMLDTGGYGFRWTDIGDPSRRATTRSYALGDRGVFRVVSQLLKAAPAATFRILIDILSDKERLSHHGTRYGSAEATVGSLSACLIYAHFGDLSVDQIWHDVVETAVPFSDALTHALAQDFPEETLRQIELRLKNPLRSITVNLTEALSAIAGLPESPAYIKSVREIVVALAGRNDDQTWLLFNLARASAVGLPDTLSVQLAITRYERSGKWDLIVDSVVDGRLALQDALNRVMADGRISEAVFWRAVFDRLRWRGNLPIALVKRAFEFLRSRFPPSDRDGKFAGDLESLIYDFDFPTAEEAGLFDFVAQCIATKDENILTNLSIAAVPAPGDGRNPDRIAIMRKVQSALAQEPLSEEFRKEMIARFVGASPDNESAEIIRSILLHWSFCPAAKFLLIESQYAASYHEETRLWILSIYRELLPGDHKIKLDAAIERLRNVLPWDQSATEEIVDETLCREP